MAVFVKICGICSGSDLEQISALKPNALGFVFWKKSKRAVDPVRIGAWSTPPSIQRVGVFVNPTESELLAISKAARLDVIQLHKIPADWTISRERFPKIEFWKAGALDDFENQSLAFNFDRYLIDSYDPKTIGGTGQTCDWTRAKKQIITTQTPTLLAGGLNPTNVAEAIHRVAPWGIDVSSGVEVAPGEKDLKKVAAFLVAARAAG